MADETKDTSADAAEASLMALLTGEGAAANDERDDEEQDDTGTEGETADGEGDDEGADDGEQDDADDSDEDDDGEQDDADDEDEEDDSGKPTSVPDDAVIFTIDRDGKSVPVTKGEAQKGFMLQADYSRKTAELATDRTAIQTERQQLSEALAQVMAAMDGADAEATPEKLAELARENPQEAMRLRLEREARDAQRQKIKAAQDELDARTKKEREAAALEHQKAEFRKLLEVMPELKDESKAKAVLTDMTKAAVAAGFTEADMNGVTDHRLMVLLKLAAEGLRLSGKKPPKPQPKGEKVPAIKPGVRVPGKSNRRQAERVQRAKQTHSVDAAVAALLGDMEAASSKRRSQ